jgi:hypothetical protein
LGVAIGGAILQNSLQSNLPPSFLAQLPAGISVAYSAIPSIHSLEEPLKTQVRTAFAQSTRLLWQVMIGISGLGLATVTLMREESMRTDVDEKWGLEGDKNKAKETRKDNP